MKPVVLGRQTNWTVVVAALLALVAMGCGNAGSNATVQDTGSFSGFDIQGSGKDAAALDTVAADDAGTDAAVDDSVSGDGAAGADGGNPSIASVVVEAAGAVELADKTALTITVNRADGSSQPPSSAEKIAVVVDGQPLDLGAQVGEDPAAPPRVNVWKGTTPGTYWLAGVRPGTAQVTLSVAGVAASPLTVEVTDIAVGSDGSGAGLALMAPGGGGKTPGLRVKDADDTIKLEGKTFGPGGLTLTLRFPATAKAGDTFDLAKPPAAGGLNITAVVPDLGTGGGKQLKILQGMLFVDQVDDGWFRGTLLGTAADLTPVTGRFAVPRTGDFGVDLLGEAVQVADGTTLKYTDTGIHTSRVAVGEVGNGQAMLTWRRIDDVTTGSLQRATLDATTGTLTPLPPLVKACQNKVLVDDGQGGQIEQVGVGEFVGWASAALRDGVQRLVVWEGKAVKGASPYQITAQELDDTLQPKGAPLVVSDDACWGQCRPRLVPLPSSRWLVVWGQPAGGIKAAILDGNNLTKVEKTVTIAQAPATNPAAAALDANVALVWRDPTLGTRYRLYSDKLASNGIEDVLGGTVANVAPPAVVALSSPPSFAALFFDPVTALKQRRINLSAALLAGGDVAVSTDAVRVAAAAGKAGQIAVVERISGKITGAPQLVVRKLQYASPGDPGTPLGPAVVLSAAAGGVPLEVALTYISDRDTFVVAWSGDVTSQGVWTQRFR